MVISEPRSENRLSFSNFGHSAPKIEALPGTLVVERRACGRPNCRCQRGVLHGPYHYRRWYEDGRRRRRYVPAADVEAVRYAIALWRLAHPSARSMRSTLRELSAIERSLRND